MLSAKRFYAFLSLIVLLSALHASCTRGELQKRQELAASGLKWEVISGVWEAKDNGLIGSGGTLWSAQDLEDAIVELEVEFLHVPGDRTVGIGFHSSGTNGNPLKGNGYGFNFTAGNRYNIFKGVNHDWRPINPAFKEFQPLPALTKKKNQIRIEMKGNRYSISVNGQLVANFEDSTHPKGRLSFWVESTMWEVKFSNIKITKN